MLNTQLPPVPAFICLLLITVFLLDRYYASKRHHHIKVLVFPLLLGACAVAAATVGARLGYGAPAALPASFEYVAHRTVVVQGERRWIDVLLVARTTPSADARLHRTRWTRKLEEVLQQAEEMSDGPGRIVLTARPAGARGEAAGYSATWEPLQHPAPKQGPQLPVDPFELLV